MIGTEDGCWFSLAPLQGGLTDYEFYQDDVLLEHGVCAENEVFIRFDALVKARRGVTH